MSEWRDHGDYLEWVSKQFRVTVPKAMMAPNYALLNADALSADEARVRRVLNLPVTTRIVDSVTGAILYERPAG